VEACWRSSRARNFSLLKRSYIRDVYPAHSQVLMLVGVSVFMKELVHCIQLQSQAHCKHSLRHLWQSFNKTSYTYGDINQDILNPNHNKQILP
jgi:hypothetical protein